MPFNPLGFQCPFDWGNAQIVGGMARAAISGGQLVVASGTTGVVSSGTSSFLTSDITWSVTTVSGLDCNGIACYNAGSNQPLAVAVNAVALLPCFAAVTAGRTVAALGDDAVGDSSTAAHIIGRALTAGASGGFALIHLKP